MKKQEIISVLYELYKITGFRMSLHDINFNEIAAYPEFRLPLCSEIQKLPGEFDRCRECDKSAFKQIAQTKETVIYKCRHGLTEAVSPLYNFGILTGYLMMGQIFGDTVDTDAVARRLIAIGCSDANKLIKETNVVSEDLINSYVKVMTICAQYLTLSGAMPGERPTIAEAAKRYIHENLDKKITIKDLCSSIGCSKTTLIASYKKEFGTTVNAAITEAKIEEAKKLLAVGKLSINEIARATGFYDQAYFSKVFSAACGMPPSEYRREDNQ
jgi:AraC-like DNA-binding protein